MRQRIARTPLILASLAIALLACLPHGMAARPGDRTIAFYNIHTKETLEVTYRKSGRLDPVAKKKIDWLMRDWRRAEAIEMDIRLIDLLWEIHRELDSRQPIHLISGYRAPETNATLRKTRGGQARKSRHMTGEAADVHFPDVSVRELRYSALVREQGGVGYYPTAAIPFVHVDTGQIRAWPRLPREELALLFPGGRTRHLPVSGPPLSRADAIAARSTAPELAKRVAAFHELRQHGRRSTLVAGMGSLPIPASRISRQPERQSAALSPPREAEPTLLGSPRIIQRPPPPATRQPTDADRRQLDALAAQASRPHVVMPNDPVVGRPRDERPQVVSRDPLTSPDPPTRFAFAAAWVQSPEYDDEHPGELSYRPFPIMPYLTRSASFDEPVLARLTYRASARVFALLNEADSHPSLQIRQERQVAEVFVADEAAGRPVDTAALTSDASSDARLPSQRIQTRSER